MRGVVLSIGFAGFAAAVAAGGVALSAAGVGRWGGGAAWAQEERKGPEAAGAAPEGDATEREGLVVETAFDLPPGAPAVFLAGAHVPVRVTLRNTSKTRTLPVVRPGDGSDEGWREPRVRWDAFTVGATGAAAPLPRNAGARCGNFDANWHDEVVLLAPGERLDLGNAGARAPESAFDLQRGRIRLVFRYEYGGGRFEKRPPSLSGDAAQGPGPMGETAPFVLVAAPLEFTVDRPFEVTARPKGPFRKGAVVTFRDLATVTVSNPNGTPRTLTAGVWTLHPELRGAGGDIEYVEAEAGRPGTKDRLFAPGAAADAFSLPAAVQRTKVRFLAAGTVRLAVWLVDGTGARIRSDWADVVVTD